MSGRAGGLPLTSQLKISIGSTQNEAEVPHRGILGWRESSPEQGGPTPCLISTTNWYWVLGYSSNFTKDHSTKAFSLLFQSNYSYFSNEFCHDLSIFSLLFCGIFGCKATIWKTLWEAPKHQEFGFLGICNECSWILLMSNNRKLNH